MIHHFGDQLSHRIHQLSNPTVVGLDPRLKDIPSYIKDEAIKRHGKTLEAVAESILSFNKGIIDAVCHVVAIVKPQIAFYEQYGHAGLKAYEETVAYAHSKGLLVLGDVKRSDIGSTAEAYATGHLGTVDVFGEQLPTINTDAVTVNPYLGSDCIQPFLKVCKEQGKGIFVLVRTSNESADEIQGLPTGDSLVDEQVATLVEGWGRDLIGESGYSSVGAVVGATYPEEAKNLRQLMPHQIILVPGYGAQGGTAADVKPCFHANGTGAIVNSSRGIIFAYIADKMNERAYAEAARAAALRMKDDLNRLF